MSVISLVSGLRHRAFLATAVRLGLVSTVIVALGIFVDGNAFWIRLATSAAILYIVCGSFNIVFGYAGLFHLGHIAIYGVGAYGSVVMISRWDISFWLAVPLSMVLTGLVGVLVALPTARLGGLFLALGTLAAAVAGEEVFLHWEGVTGGFVGFSDIRVPSLFGVELQGGRIQYFWFVAVVAGVCFEIFSRTSQGSMGRKLVALRESEVATESVGINPVRVRVLAFAYSGMFVGLAGALYAHFVLYISPDSFALSQMIEVLIVVLIGGAGTRLGPVLGVVALVVLDEWGHSVGDASPLMFGAAIVLVISFAPSGLVGIGSGIIGRFRTSGVSVADGDDDRRAGLVEATASVDLGDAADHRLVIAEISLRFAELRALHEVSFEIVSGEVVGLIGPNGAGKTSAVNVITGRVEATSGKVQLDGRELTGMKPYEIAQAGVVRTFQSTQLVPSFDLVTNVILSRHGAARATTAEQMLGLPRAAADDRAAREDAMQLLDVVGVASLAEERAGDLPYGVQRRAEIAKALALRPMFLLLDEPGAGLSSFEREDVAEAIEAVASHGVGCLLIDHNIPFVACACSRLVVLSAGEILRSGSTDEVLADVDVIKAYLGAAVTT